jgi:hypothetical protein
VKNADRSSVPPPKPADGRAAGTPAAVVLPWVVAVVFAAAAAGLWLTRPAPQSAGPEPGSAAGLEPESESPATAGAAEPAERRRLAAALDECRLQLDASRDLLERRGGAAPPVPAPVAAPQVDCLAQPAVLAELERRAADEARQTTELQAKQRLVERAAHNEAARRMLEQAAGLSPAESQHIADLLCAARDLRAVAVREMIVQGASPQEVGTRLRDERRTILEDLAQYLGRERFGRLARVDGAALMAGSVECEGPTAP